MDRFQMIMEYRYDLMQTHFWTLIFCALSKQGARTNGFQLILEYSYDLMQAYLKCLNFLSP